MVTWGRSSAWPNTVNGRSVVPPLLSVARTTTVCVAFVTINDVENEVVPASEPLAIVELIATPPTITSSTSSSTRAPRARVSSTTVPVNSSGRPMVAATGEVVGAEKTISGGVSACTRTTVDNDDASAPLRSSPTARKTTLRPAIVNGGVKPTSQ